MRTISRKPIKGWKRQQGMTLMELLVAGVISLIAATGMVIVMANTLGTGSQTIQAARLTQEMRTAMQIMSRELRRANYHSNYMACYGNTNCLKEMPDPDDPLVIIDISDKIQEITIEHTGSNPTDSDCFYFWYDRPQVSLDDSPASAFRRVEAGGVGVIQMIHSEEDTISCSDLSTNPKWVEITDPDIIDVTGFDVVDAGFSETINTAGDTQQVERIGLTIWAELVNDPLFLTASTPTAVSREMQEFITVRNHTTTAVASP